MIVITVPEISVRFRFPIVLALVSSVIVSMAFLIAYRRITDAFLSGVITLDGLLIGAITFVFPLILEASQLREFKGEAWKQYQQSKNASQRYFSQLVTRSMALLILVPVLLMAPFFLSAVLALIGLVSFCDIRTYLGIAALWLMLWAILSVLLASWKITVFLRRVIRSET
jgi:hypothetical protein